VVTTVEERQINIDGLSIRYLQAGQDGFPLVLLHGTGESAIDWSWVIPNLADNYRVYAPDFPGSGGSTKPTREYSLEFFTQFAINFLNALAIEQAVLVGNSLGGLIALRIASSHPQRVAALGLVDSAGLGEAVNPLLSHLTIPLYGEIALAGCKTPIGASLRTRSRAALQFAHPGQIHSAWIAEQEHLSQMPGFLEATLSSLRAQLTPLKQHAVMVDVLPQLQMPTLIVWGADDLIFPKQQAQAAVERIPQAYLRLIPDCGHIPPLERPEQFTAALREFLTKINL
jgi:pimeloyl-ACP methyl ester carboxylesterase